MASALPARALVSLLSLTALPGCASPTPRPGADAAQACHLVIRDAGRELLALELGAGELRGGQTVLTIEDGAVAGFLAGVPVRWRASAERIQGSIGEASLDLAVAREGDALALRGPTDRGRLTARASPALLEAGNEQVLLELRVRPAAGEAPGEELVYVDGKGLIEVRLSACPPALLQERPELLASLALLLVGLPVRG